MDFVVERAGIFSRVQVKTASWNRSSGPHSYLQCRTRPTNGEQHRSPAQLYDLLVAVGDVGVWCIPAEEIDSKNLSLEGTHPEYKRPKWDKYRMSL